MIFINILVHRSMMDVEKWMIIDIMKIRVDDMVNLKWLMSVLINVNMNGMVINSSTNEKNDSMN